MLVGNDIMVPRWERLKSQTHNVITAWFHCIDCVNLMPSLLYNSRSHGNTSCIGSYKWWRLLKLIKALNGLHCGEKKREPLLFGWVVGRAPLADNYSLEWICKRVRREELLSPNAAEIVWRMETSCVQSTNSRSYMSDCVKWLKKVCCKCIFWTHQRD